MSAVKPMLSPRELAAAIGVSESSLKRWADSGAIVVTRTTGGHRRIAITEAIRFIRRMQMPVVRPDVLGLGDLDTLEATIPPTSDAADGLFVALRTGNAAAARGMLLSSYLEGRSIAAIFDHPLREALRRLGELYEQRGDAGIYEEHRATDLCIQAIQYLRALIAGPRGAPVAVGCAPAGDPYIIPSLAAATVLAAEGFQPINLGPNTPVPALRQAVDRNAPRLVWLSVSSTPDPTGLSRDLRQFTIGLPRGVQVILGGRCAERIRLKGARPAFGESMTELAAFARGMIANADPP